ncbi:unnamed protein product, partial [Urochloa humidicola]
EGRRKRRGEPGTGRAKKTPPPLEPRRRLLPLHRAAAAAEGGRLREGEERQPRDSTAARTPPMPRRHTAEPTPPFCFFSTNPAAIPSFQYPSYDPEGYFDHDYTGVDFDDEYNYSK